MKALPLIHSFYSLPPGDEIIVSFPSGGSETRKINAIEKLGGLALVSLREINNPETALKYRGAILSTDQHLLLPQLQADEYFHDQIIGLAVVTTEGDIIGTVSDIIETGSNDVYVVTGTDREYLIPAIYDVIREINLEEDRIIIRVLEGLLD